MTAANGTTAIEKVHTQLEKTSLQKGAVQEKLTHTAERIQYGADVALAYADLLRNQGETYKNAPDSVKRDLLTALFDDIHIYVDETGVTAELELSEANSLVRSVMAHSEPQVAPERKKKAPRETAKGQLTETSLSGSLAVGSTNSYVATRGAFYSNFESKEQLFL